MEAGLEHLSRSTTKASDIMLVVAEPYYKSLETASRVKKMAEELGIPRVFLVANKVRSEREAEAIHNFSERHGLELIATIPFDEEVAASSLLPEAPLDYCPDSEGVRAVGELAEKLLAMEGSAAAESKPVVR